MVGTHPRVLFEKQHRLHFDGVDKAMSNDHGIADPVDSEALDGVSESERTLEAR